MATTISVNVENGQELMLPFEVSGSASDPAFNLTTVVWDVDNGQTNEVSEDPPDGAIDFNFTIGDCGDAEWHILNITAWDINGVSVSESRTFTVIGVADDEGEQNQTL